jgi:hypothetical protein
MFTSSENNNSENIDDIVTLIEESEASVEE